jgi:hypothetical protein
MSTAMVLVAVEQANWTDQRNGLCGVKDIVHHTDYAEVCVKPRFCGDGLRS